MRQCALPPDPSEQNTRDLVGGKVPNISFCHHIISFGRSYFPLFLSILIGARKSDPRYVPGRSRKDDGTKYADSSCVKSRWLLDRADHLAPRRLVGGRRHLSCLGNLANLRPFARTVTDLFSHKRSVTKEGDKSCQPRSPLPASIISDS